MSSSAYPPPQHCLLHYLLGLEVASSSYSPAAPTAYSTFSIRDPGFVPKPRLSGMQLRSRAGTKLGQCEWTVGCLILNLTFL